MKNGPIKKTEIRDQGTGTGNRKTPVFSDYFYCAPAEGNFLQPPFDFAQGRLCGGADAFGGWVVRVSYAGVGSSFPTHPQRTRMDGAPGTRRTDSGLRSVAPPVPECEGPGAPSFVVWKYPGIGNPPRLRTLGNTSLQIRHSPKGPKSFMFNRLGKLKRLRSSS